MPVDGPPRNAHAAPSSPPICSAQGRIEPLPVSFLAAQFIVAAPLPPRAHILRRSHHRDIFTTPLCPATASPCSCRCLSLC
ncbi:hypothetical protein M0R45_002006 [Rubus argutus]|uniref:Uncharacterized protein n=1 Tax=Rubus argutus TaxID=59490 RepID=A0AAW1VHL7_RUBAR